MTAKYLLWLPKSGLNFYRSRSKVFRIVVPLLVIGVTIFLLVVGAYQIQRARAVYLYKILPIGILPTKCEESIRVAHTNHALNPQTLPSAIKDGYFSIEEFDRYIKSRTADIELQKSFENFTAAAADCGLPTDRLAGLMDKLYKYSQHRKGFLIDPTNPEPTAGDLYNYLIKLGY